MFDQNLFWSFLVQIKNFFFFMNPTQKGLRKGLKNLKKLKKKYWVLYAVLIWDFQGEFPKK